MIGLCGKRMDGGGGGAPMVEVLVLRCICLCLCYVVMCHVISNDAPEIDQSTLQQITHPFSYIQDDL